MLLALNKPYRVLSQFNSNPDQKEQATLLEAFPHLPPDLQPYGRLDYDSEGLLILSSKARLSQLPESVEKEYYVQVEGTLTGENLTLLRAGGLEIRAKKKTYRCLPATVETVKNLPFKLWSRHPAVESTSETQWLRIVLQEGRNRQIRRMTAAVGHPTLRLIRYRIGNVTLENLHDSPFIEIERSHL